MRTHALRWTSRGAMKNVPAPRQRTAELAMGGETYMVMLVVTNPNWGWVMIHQTTGVAQDEDELLYKERLPYPEARRRYAESLRRLPNVLAELLL